jgi:integrase
VDDIVGDKVYIRGATVCNTTGLVYKDTNKSSAGRRTVTMPPALAQLVHKRCAKVKTGKLFSLHPSTTLERFQRLLVKNNMPKYTIQSLRHCFAATMHALNIFDKIMQQNMADHN